MTSKPGIAEPYTAIAPVYDYMMSHVDYPGWADYIIDLISQFGNGGTRVLDAGCGTGCFAGQLSGRGYEVFAFDRSYPMLQACRGRGVSRLWLADLRHMGVRLFADVVICLYDTVHYLRPEEMDGFFRSAHEALKPGGLLIFDVITEAFLKAYWGDYQEWDETGALSYLRKSWYDPREKCQHTEIRIQARGTKTAVLEHHRQWLFSLPALSAGADGSGFSEVGRYDECSFQPGTDASDRIHFVFRK